MQQFEHGYTETFTTTVTRAVGPTTISGARGTLPQPSPTDGNSIWLATNGTGGGIGTSGDPTNTLALAIGLLDASHPTVHVFRNGAVGDLDFTEAAGSTLPASRNLQVEDGEIANFIFTTGGLTCGGTNTVNGVTVDPIILVTPVITGVVYDNVKVLDATATNGLGEIRFGSGTVMNYSVAGHVSSTNTGSTDTITNCLISAEGAGIGETERGAIEIFNDASSTNTINITRSLIIARGSFQDTTATNDPLIAMGIINFRSDIPGTGSRTVNINMTSCYVSNEGAAGVYSGLFDAIYTTNYTLDFTLFQTTKGFYFIRSTEPDTTETYTDTNTIAIQTAPMFVNFASALQGNLDDFRLQFLGKATSTGGKFQLPSPLIGAGLAGVDVNPWDETTTGPVRSFGSPATIYYPASDYTKSRPFNQPVLVNDLQAGPHTGYNGRNRKFDLGWGSGDKYASNNDLDTLEIVTADTGSIRWYPRGIGTTIFDLAVSGIFTATTATEGTFIPDIISGIPMKTNKHQGQWITIGGKHYRISANTISTFTLVDKLSEGLPTDGVNAFTIEYWVIKFDVTQIDMSATQRFFTDFLAETGSSFSEFEVGRSPLNQKLHELKDYNIILLEANDLEEGTT